MNTEKQRHRVNFIFGLAGLIAGGFMLRYGVFFLPEQLPLGLFLLSVFGVLSVWSGKIDALGALTGVGIGLGLFLGGGFPALGLLLVFFVCGSVASQWRKRWKESQGLAQARGGKRSVRHAISNGGIAGLCGLLAWSLPHQEDLFLMMLLAAFASACSDTFSSELGNVYGRRFLDLRTGKAGQRGLDGVISLEGSLWGVVGSALMVGSYGLMGGWQFGLIVPFVAGLLGNFSDSLYGAYLQRRGWLSNDEVNLLSTVTAAGLGAWGYVSLG